MKSLNGLREKKLNIFKKEGTIRDTFTSSQMVNIKKETILVRTTRRN
jgi:hypothetical protein